MVAHRPHAFADMSAGTALRLVAAWSGAVGAMLSVLILARLFG